MKLLNKKSESNIPIQVSSLDELSKFNISRIVAAIGVFDGIHLGHREIIKELIKMSKEQSATPVVITFFPHPRKVLFPDKPLRFLRTPAKKAKILGSLGIKAIVTVPFTLKFASLSPENFIENFMHPHNTKLAGICVGTKWKFGSKAKGNEQTLHNFAYKYGFVFKSVKETYWNKNLVSSTAIRIALTKGDFLLANYMLGRDYIISGHVDSSNKDSSSINIIVDYGVLPPIGIYAACINRDKSKEILIKVNSKSELIIDSNNLSLNDNKIEIEFVETQDFASRHEQIK